MTIDQLILWLGKGELQKLPVAITDGVFQLCASSKCEVLLQRYRSR